MAVTNSQSIHNGESSQYAYALAIFCGGIAFILPQVGIPVSSWLSYGLVAALFGSIWPYKALQWGGWICLPIGMLICVDFFVTWSINSALFNIIVLIKALAFACIGAYVGSKLSVRKIANRLSSTNGENAQDISRNGVKLQQLAVPMTAVARVPGNGPNGSMRVIEPSARAHSLDAALIKAAQEHALDTLKLLVAAGADVNARSRDQWSPFTVALPETQAEGIESIFGHGIARDQKTDKGWTALMTATIEGHAEVVGALLEHGAHVDAENNEGWTALRFAVSMDETEILRLLLEAGANPDVADREGKTALMQAAGENIEASVKLLLEAGADPAIEDGSGQTAALIAQKQGHVEIVSVLKKAEARSSAALAAENDIPYGVISVFAEKTHRVIRIRRDQYYGLIDRYDVILTGAPLPNGWEETGAKGTEQECRDYSWKNNIDEPSELGWWLVFSN
jgi:ankyrin repeat protein